jgi:hypothetical protein
MKAGSAKQTAAGGEQARWLLRRGGVQWAAYHGLGQQGRARDEGGR